VRVILGSIAAPPQGGSATDKPDVLAGIYWPLEKASKQTGFDIISACDITEKIWILHCILIDLGRDTNLISRKDPRTHSSLRKIWCSSDVMFSTIVSLWALEDGAGSWYASFLVGKACLVPCS
jgi:hypothetical protein